MIAIIANPNALRFNIKTLKNIVSLLENSGVSVDIFFTQKAGDGTLIANRIANKYEIIAAYGGDGIINEIINAKIKDSALGILPAGTTNVLALDLNIDLNPEKAAKLFINPKFKKIYLGSINDRRFVLMAGVGFDAESVKNVNAKIKKLSGKFAYFLSGLYSYLISKNDPFYMDIDEKRYKTNWVIISKAKKYAGNFIASNDIDVDKPFLDVCIFKKVAGKYLDLLLYNIAFFGGLSYHVPFIEHIVTNKTINTTKAPVQIDGDFFGVCDAEISLCKKPINIVVP